MKLVIIIMITCLVQVSAATFGQRITLTETNAPLEQVLKKIKQQTGFDVLYKDHVLSKSKSVNVQLKNVSLEKALDEIFDNQSLTYTLADRTIVIKEKEQSFIDRVIARFQSIDVRGKVVDSLGNGLAGATVSVKNGRGSTSTDNNGNFYLDNVEERSMLVVTYLGYISKEQVASKDFTYITLHQGTSKLDEVQVMAYGTTSRRLSTGNITSLKAVDLERQNINNPVIALQGRVPNLIITTAGGDPNSPVKIQLRGRNSITANRLTSESEPLYVIDGIPYQNNIHLVAGSFGSTGNSDLSALSFLNTSDIESIDVLADADATSIYGSRGGNGVILITTKKGKSGDFRLTGSVNSGFSQIPKNRKLPLLTTAEYLEMRREAFKNDNQIVPTNPSDYNEGNFDLTVWDKNKYTDWQEELLGGHPVWQNADISISGGSQQVQYMMSGSFRKQGYVFPSGIKNVDDANNLSGRAHFSLTGNSPNGKWSSTITSSLSNNKINGSSTNFAYIAYKLPPNAPNLYSESGELNWEPNPGSATGAATWLNPLASLRNTFETNINTLINSAVLSYKIRPNLMIRLTSGFTSNRLTQLQIFPLTAVDPSTLNHGATASTQQNFTTTNTWTIDPQLLYRTQIFKGNIDALVGTTIQGQRNASQNFTAGGYKDDSQLRNLAFADRLSSYAFNSTTEYKYFGMFGRLNYNLDSKYILNSSYRRDGSSRFGPNRQYGNYWSIGSAWIFTKEKFVKDHFPAISFGKLRFSYGTSGSDGIGDYKFLELYENTSQSSTYQGIKTIKSGGAINSEYSWETIKKVEIGLDLAFLADRIIISGAQWRTRSSNQIGSFSVPATSGATSILVNQDVHVENRGWDVTLNSTNVTNSSFEWKTTANFGIQYNKIRKFPSTFISFPYLINYQQRAEDPVGLPFADVLFLAKYEGVDPITGLYTFSDKDGNETSTDYLVNFSSQKRNITPRELGIVNTFRFKDFTLSFTIQLRKQLGLSYLYQTNTPPGSFNSSQYSTNGNQPKDVFRRWRTAGDISDIQRFTQDYSEAYNVYQIMNLSDRAYVDASFMRINNASLSFEIPESWKSRINIKNAKLHFSGQNLFTLTKYKYVDPETLDINSLPTLRTVTFGFTLGF